MSVEFFLGRKRWDKKYFRHVGELSLGNLKKSGFQRNLQTPRLSVNPAWCLPWLLSSDVDISGIPSPLRARSASSLQPTAHLDPSFRYLYAEDPRDLWKCFCV